MQRTNDPSSSGTDIWRDGSLIAYDRVPYRSEPLPQSHPDRAATIARLLGVSAPPPESARILELGCASGGNLLPMAEQLPGATLLGIDASRNQIEAGQKLRRRAGLENVELRHQDISTFESSEPFDYIIAHGVYSWVPPEIQESLLRVISETLAPNGIAYVSYNTYPGWCLQEMVREMMLFASRRVEEPREKLVQAKEYLDLLVKGRPEQDPLRELLAAELDALEQEDLRYLMHEHFEEHNQPVYFYQFMEQATRHGLGFLGEVEFGQTDRQNLPETIREELVDFSDDLIRAEQHIDFRVNNTFRQTLLCRSQIRPDRRFESIDWSQLLIATDATVDTIPLDPNSSRPVHFRRQDSVLRTNEPLVKAAFLLLADEWPSAMPFDDLVRGAWSRLGSTGSSEQASLRLADLLRRAFGAGLVDLRTSSPRLSRVPSDYPTASSLARAQAEDGLSVTNLLHRVVNLDRVKLTTLVACDGELAKDEIVRDVSDQLLSGAESESSPSHREQVEARVADALEGLASMALLIE